MKARTLFSISLLVLLGACGDTFDGRAVAEPEVKEFHELLKAKDFEAMYRRSSTDFQAAAPKEKVLALYAAIDRKLGALQTTKQINWSVNTRNLVTTVVLVYASQFQDGEATETFTFRVKSGEAELIGYNIASFDMLIK